MPYQLQPHGVVLFSDMPRVVVKMAQDNPELDLAQMDWVPSTERPYSEKLVRGVLRCGVACSTGIVADLVDLVPIGRVEELQRVSANSSEARAATTPHAALIEQLLPGSAEYGRELDARIADTMRQAIEEAQQEEAEFFSQPVIPELAAHWERLGGRLPDPR